MEATPSENLDWPYLTITVSIFTPILESEMSLPQLPEIKAEPVVVQIQVLPSISDREQLPQDIVVSIEAAATNGVLTRDVTIGDDDLPGFVIGGKVASSAWDYLRRGGTLDVHIDIPDHDNLEFKLKSDQITIAAPMFEACLNAVREERAK